LESSIFAYKIRPLKDMPNVVAVDLTGGVFPSNMDALKEVYLRILDMEGQNVILNFKNLEYIGSSGIGLLMQMTRECAKVHIRLWISDLYPEMSRVFHQLSIDRFFTILPTEKDIVQQIQADRKTR
jgi:anti-anti-sigma factor